MTMHLIVRTPGKWLGKNIFVKRFPVSIGRARGCHIRVTTLQVSSRHCALSAREGKVYVRDLGSANGTMLNGKKISGESELHDHDRLQVGPVDFEVLIENSTSASHRTRLPAALGQATVANEEDVSALLLSIEDDNGPPARTLTVDSAGAGRTAPDTSPCDETSQPEPARTQPRKADNTPSAAADLLQKYVRRASL
jgi:predicted component of type VI protein secretion system